MTGIKQQIRDDRSIVFRLVIVILVFMFFQWFMAYISLPLNFRVDLFLYLIVGVAPFIKPLHHFFLAIALGYLLDGLSGRLWGFHIATYVCGVAFIHLTAEEMEMRSMPYQVILTAICAIIQALFVLVYAVNSYDGFPNVLDFVWSVLATRFAVTIIAAFFFLTIISAWLKGEIE
jgi:cell shape-determining protein MreD